MSDQPRGGGQRHRPPTIRDVAQRAGVSPATVSSVLTGLRPVAEESRRQVREAIEALGFKANHMASSLRRGMTRTVGVVLPDLAGAFYASMVRHYEAKAAQSGYEVMVVASGENPATEAARIHALIARRVDGLLVVPANDHFATAPGFPASLPPTVLISRGFAHPGFDTVTSDNVGGGRRGCEYLLELGHRDIALLAPDIDGADLRDRVAGYLGRLQEAGLTERARVVIGGPSVDECRSAIEQELRRPDAPTAVFATTYFATVGAIKAIQAADLAFPEAVSLIGWAHADWMTAIRPYLTAISQASDELAAASWRILQERIAGWDGAPARVQLPCRFSVRESVRTPRVAATSLA